VRGAHVGNRCVLQRQRGELEGVNLILHPAFGQHHLGMRAEVGCLHLRRVVSRKAVQEVGLEVGDLFEVDDDDLDLGGALRVRLGEGVPPRRAGATTAPSPPLGCAGADGCLQEISAATPERQELAVM
jgi:hypothetical protein